MISLSIHIYLITCLSARLSDYVSIYLPFYLVLKPPLFQSVFYSLMHLFISLSTYLYASLLSLRPPLIICLYFWHFNFMFVNIFCGFFKLILNTINCFFLIFLVVSWFSCSPLFEEIDKNRIVWFEHVVK